MKIGLVLLFLLYILLYFQLFEDILIDYINFGQAESILPRTVTGKQLVNNLIHEIFHLIFSPCSVEEKEQENSWVKVW